MKVKFTVYVDKDTVLNGKLKLPRLLAIAIEYGPAMAALINDYVALLCVVQLLRDCPIGT